MQPNQYQQDLDNWLKLFTEVQCARAHFPDSVRTDPLHTLVLAAIRQATLQANAEEQYVTTEISSQRDEMRQDIKTAIRVVKNIIRQLGAYNRR